MKTIFSGSRKRLGFPVFVNVHEKRYALTYRSHGSRERRAWHAEWGKETGDPAIYAINVYPKGWRR